MIIKTISGYILKRVDDYKYLGSFASSSEKDFNTRKGMAWSTCNDLHKIWTSKLASNIKIKVFRATIEPILLYGSETWTLLVRLEKRLDGCYIRLHLKFVMEKASHAKSNLRESCSSIDLSQATENAVCGPLSASF